MTILIFMINGGFYTSPVTVIWVSSSGCNIDRNTYDLILC